MSTILKRPMRDRERERERDRDRETEKGRNPCPLHEEGFLCYGPFLRVETEISGASG